jgi:hypothetical protein
MHGLRRGASSDLKTQSDNPENPILQASDPREKQQPERSTGRRALFRGAYCRPCPLGGPVTIDGTQRDT